MPNFLQRTFRREQRTDRSKTEVQLQGSRKISFPTATPVPTPTPL